MNPLNPWFAVAVYLIAFGTAFLINRRYKVVHSNIRYESIDGLRGLLALGVFIHHSTIWHQYLHTGNWLPPQSNLFTQLGQTSVSLFFMITSFLFTTKLIEAGEGFSWRNFFVSRIYRLVPMYYASVLLVILAVMFSSYWKLNVPISELLKSIKHWALFTISGEPPINDAAVTSRINAGVAWSLPFEWLFYFSLPLLSLFIFKTRPARPILLISTIFIAYFYSKHDVSPYFLYPFAGGAIAAVLVRYPDLRKKLQHPAANIAILICLGMIGLFNSPVYNVILTTIAFTLIAMGNSMFGLLKHATLKLLGEVSYSTYLLHGVILFTVLYFGIGMDNARQLSPMEFCSVIFLVTPLVVVISVLGFKYVELPFIEKYRMRPKTQGKLTGIYHKMVGDLMRMERRKAG